MLYKRPFVWYHMYTAMSPSGKAWVCKTLIHRFDSGHGLTIEYFCSGGGMVYAKDLKSFASNGLRVRVPPRALLLQI
jgi:hypothetical protein